MTFKDGNENIPVPPEAFWMISACANGFVAMSGYYIAIKIGPWVNVCVRIYVYNCRTTICYRIRAQHRLCARIALLHGREVSANGGRPRVEHAGVRTNGDA